MVTLSVAILIATASSTYSSGYTLLEDVTVTPGKAAIPVKLKSNGTDCIVHATASSVRLGEIKLQPESLVCDRTQTEFEGESITTYAFISEYVPEGMHNYLDAGWFIPLDYPELQID